MFSRMTRLLALAVAMVLPTFAAAADDKFGDEPSLLIRVQSVNDLMKSVKYIASLLSEDQAEQIKQGISLIEGLIDPKTGLEGIDTKNPIGFYATLTPEVTSSPVVALVPIADQKTVLEALKMRAKIEIKEGKDGLYETTPDGLPVTLYFRFANGYAYITANDPENILPKSLPKPEKVLGGRAEHLLSATVRMDRLPEQMKKLALGAVENQLAVAKEQPIPNETKAIKALRDQAVDEMASTIKTLLNDGKKISLRLNIDPKEGEFAIEAEMAGVKDSKLAKDILSIQTNKSVVGGAIASPDAAATFNISMSLAAALKKVLGPAVDDAVEELKKQAPGGGEVQELAKPLIEALLPTIKAGELDAGASLLGPDKDGKMTMLAGLKVTNGKKIESAVKDTVKKLPPDAAGLFVLDAEKLSGDSMLHTVKVAGLLPEEVKKMFGDNDVHLTFRDDLLLVAIGPAAKDALKKGIASTPADVGVLKFEVAMAKLATAVAESAEKAAAAKKAAAKVFDAKAPAGSDKVSVTITGGDSIKLKIAAKGKAIQFLAEMAALAEKKDN